jgi:hypothetical protein
MQRLYSSPGSKPEPRAMRPKTLAYVGIVAFAVLRPGPRYA